MRNPKNKRTRRGTKKNAKYEGARLRSKGKYTIEGEKSTKFFFNLEKGKGLQNMITELRGKDGKIVAMSEEMLIEVKEF